MCESFLLDKNDEMAIISCKFEGSTAHCKKRQKYLEVVLSPNVVMVILIPESF